MSILCVEFVFNIGALNMVGCWVLQCIAIMVVLRFRFWVLVHVFRKSDKFHNLVNSILVLSY